MTDIVDAEDRIIDVNISSEMRTSFLEYAYSVIYSRALPDARDGLKPVQRRILYAMTEMGLRPDRPHVKCARVVGDVMGKLHPHGDMAIYDALVRLAQPWSMRLPLLDGHGNFGSLDAGPAAPRYTECRMAPAALAMTAGMDHDTVDFRPNYDGKETEPHVLPAAFPNLLVNGATGIAVGMATNMAPHNLVEVVAGLRHLLRHPDADLETLMRFVPGPDLPGGGTIIGLQGIQDAYETGRGTFKIRATARIEQVSPRRRGIVFTELPYLIGPERIIEQIKNLVQSKRLTGISDVKDLTDLDNGTRLVVEVKNGINPEALLEQLYKLTKLEDTFGINNVALVDGQPRTMGLKELMQVYLDHRLEVVLRRSTYLLGRAQDRLHLVDGLLVAIVDIDEVIAIIRSSDDAASAKERLMGVFDLTDPQATYILDMQLRRLTKMSRIELEAERDELHRQIADLQQIIDDPARLRSVVSEELGQVAKEFGTPRRTVLLAASGAPTTAAAPLEIADDPCWVLVSSTGLIARTSEAITLPEVSSRSRHDVIRSAIRTTAQGEFGVITSAGRLLRARAIELPTVVVTADAPNLRGGSRVDELYPLDKGESVVCLTSLDPDSPELAVGTARGVVKRVKNEVLTKDEWQIIALDQDDRVIGGADTRDDVELCFITSDAQLLHFPAEKVRPQGRGASGVAGINLAAGARAIFFGPVAGSAVVATLSGSSDALPGTEAGSVKVTPFDDYPGKGRATGGVRCHRFLKGEDTLLLAWAGAGPAIAAAQSGSPVDLPPATGKRDGSGTPMPQPISAISSGAKLSPTPPETR